MYSISEFGLVSSVGHDVSTACASIRAGISRPSELAYAALDEDMIPISIIGHPISIITQGYYFIGRWLRLAEKALTDLVSNFDLSSSEWDQYWENTGLIVVIPDTVDRFLVSIPIDDDYILKQYIKKILAIVGFTINLKNTHIIREGHAGGVAALNLADQLFKKASLQQFLVLAVDSYIEPTSLSWLAGNGRLKSPDFPAGLMPGESAACFIVKNNSGPPLSGSQARGLNIYSAEISVDEQFDNFESSNPGRVLANTIEKALKVISGRPFSGDIFVDLNGENWRAKEFGNAMTILKKDNLLSNTNLILPCAEIGDVGVASGAVALCLAAHTYDRAYNHSSETLIISHSEDGTVGVVCVSGN